MVPPVFLFWISDVGLGTESILKLALVRAAQFPIERALLTDISNMSGLSGLLGQTIPTPPRIRQDR
jgi:hypothetical protein